MKKCFALLSILFFSTAYAQNVTLSGYIKDAANGEELINASIVNEKFQGTVTNIYGFYSLTLPEGKYTFTVSYIGYESIVKTLTLKESQTLDFELKEATNELAEVEVTAKTTRRKPKPRRDVHHTAHRKANKGHPHSF
jgi:hypothetical protein